MKQVVLLELTTIKDVLKSNQPTKKNPWCAAVKEFTKMYQGSDPFYDRLQEVFQGREGKDLPFLIVGGAVTVKTSFLFIPKQHVLPFEFTPMYCGIPINPKDSIPRASGDIIPTGYVSLNGFNSKLVAHTPESNVITVVTRTPAHLSDISGKLDNSFVHTYIHTLVLDILMNV